MDDALNSSRGGGGGGGGGAPNANGAGGPYGSQSRDQYQNQNRRGGQQQYQYGQYNNAHRGGGGRGGGRGYRGGGRHRRHGDNTNSYAPRAHHSHNNSHSNSHGQRRSQGPANRFGQNSTSSVNPKTAVLKQLSAMVAKMGDWAGVGTGMSLSSADGSAPADRKAALASISQNTSDLVAVLGGEKNASLFLAFDSSSSSSSTSETNTNTKQPAPDADADAAGPLATLLSSCAATLPLQTPSYAALGLGVHVQSSRLPGDTYDGFCQRLVKITAARFWADLDRTLGAAGAGHPNKDNATMVEAHLRCKLLLRYMALLTRAGIIVPQGSESEQDEEPGKDMSLTAFFNFLLAAAVASENRNSTHHYANAPLLLASLVLHTLPYTLTILSKDVLLSLLHDIETNILANYSSRFTPGTGMQAFLLQDEQVEEAVVDMDDEEEEEDDEDDDEEVQGSPCADTLQDLLRTVKSLVNHAHTDDIGPSDSSSTNVTGTRFALLSDEPWTTLEDKGAATASTEPNDAMEDAKQFIAFTGEPLRISLSDSCLSIPHLFSQEKNVTDVDPMAGAGTDAGDVTTLLCPSLDGIVFGRLAIFDPPPQEGDDDDEDEDVPKNENMESYIQTFTLVDRYFLADAVRDCLVCHKPSVTDTGVERGGARLVAEQIWSIAQLLDPPLSSSSSSNDGTFYKGVEYGIVEALLALMLQSNTAGHRHSLSHVYVSRILLELTRHQPTLVPQALAVAVANLFQVLPSLTPAARDNASTWLAFHLTNTEYQWPKGYWDHWTPYVTKGLGLDNHNHMKRNSRGEFVTRAFQAMMMYMSDVTVLVTHCLPPSSPLSRYLLLRNDTVDSTIAKGLGTVAQESLDAVENDLKARIWKTNENPEYVRGYMLGDEVSESVASHLEDVQTNNSTLMSDATWWRTGVIIRALLAPSQHEYRRIQKQIEKASAKDDDHVDDPNAQDAMDEDGVGSASETEDGLVDTMTMIKRYQPVLMATLAKDWQVHEENLDLRGESKSDTQDKMQMGEAYMLVQVELIAGYSRVALQSVLECLLKETLVSTMTILKWALGESYTNNTVVNTTTQWWVITSQALRVGIQKHLADATDLGADGLSGANDGGSGGLGMIIDGGGDGVASDGSLFSRRVKSVMEFTRPLVQYATRRVVALLQSQPERVNNGSKKMTPMEVDLVEGLKQFVMAAQSHVAAALETKTLNHNDTTNNIGGTTHDALMKLQEGEVHTLLKQSEISGSQLAATFCRSASQEDSNIVTPALELLASSLEGM